MGLAGWRVSKVRNIWGSFHKHIYICIYVCSFSFHFASGGGRDGTGRMDAGWMG